MNNRIKELMVALENENRNVSRIHEEMQKEYNKIFNDSKALQKAIENAENACAYTTNRYGEIESYYRFSGLSDFAECREFFEVWLSENHSLGVDWENDCLTMPQGESLIIQDDSYRNEDNGVWLNEKCVIPESQYRIDGDVDTTKRNQLIEEYMEKTGYFPGVFRVTQYGDVYFVNTKKND